MAANSLGLLQRNLWHLSSANHVWHAYSRGNYPGASLSPWWRSPATWKPSGGDSHDGWRSGWFSGYAEEIFFPACLPLKGTYDDYGCIDLEMPTEENQVVGENQVVVSDWLRSNIEEYPAGKFDIPVKMHRNMTLPEMLKAIERGGVTVKRYNGSEPLGLWMVREDMYQALLGAKLGVDHSCQDFILGSFIEHANEYYEMLLSAVANEPPNISPETLAVLPLLHASLGNDFQPLRMAGREIFDDYNKWLYEHVRGCMLDQRPWSAIPVEMAEFGFFRLAMQSMRVGFMPQAGAGSSNTETAGHAAVAAQVIETIRSMSSDFSK